MKLSPYFPISCRACGLFLGLSAAIALVSSCTTGGGGSNPDYGPFDSNGNYVEEWADNPSKWRRNPAPPPPVADNSSMMAGNDTPPKNLTPLPSPTSSSSQIESARVTSAAPQTMPKPRTSTTTTVRNTPKPTPKPVARVTPKPKPKPRAVVAKPASTRVTVKKGDTLYGLALRHKSSVSAIQKANGISGTNLKIGKTLVIPRK